MLSCLVVAAAILISPLQHQASANIGDQTLEPEMKHSDVRQLQKLLKFKGYFKPSGSYSNHYNESTTKAVKAFQKDHKIKKSGVTNRSTFNALGVYNIDNEALLETAKKYKGVRYKWGGTSPKGFDCSGFIYYVFQESQDITMPRTAAQLYSQVGLKTSEPEPGDLVFFKSGKRVSHVGIYIGDNQFIHSATSKGVSIASMDNSYWKPKYLGSKTL
ncbi:MAG: NlpC/P60 family protein [Peribacillus sp.]